MAMQGKSTSSDTPSLDVAEAEQAADAFRPAWDDDAWEIPPAPAATAAPTDTTGPDAAPADAPAIVASPVIALGKADVSESAPPKAQPAPAPPGATGSGSAEAGHDDPARDRLA